MLSLRCLQGGFGVEEMTPNQRSEFLVKWAKRSGLTWDELAKHDRHGLGYEKLPMTEIKPRVPEKYQQEKFVVFRHEGNLPFVGFRAGDVFYVLWIETKYGDLYDHG